VTKTYLLVGRFPAAKRQDGNRTAFRGGFGTGKTKIGQVFGELMRWWPAALHHRAIQQSYGVAAGAARR
jgi:hypothetical protein